MDRLSQVLVEAVNEAIKGGDSQVAIADRAGVAPIVLSRIRRGQRGTKLAVAEKIAEALGCELTVRLEPKRRPHRQQKRKPITPAIPQENEIQKRAL